MDLNSIIEEVLEKLDDTLSSIDEWDEDDSLLKIRERIESVMDALHTLESEGEDDKY